MSLQDDIFDVQAALDGKPEAEPFERVYKAFCQLERENEIALQNEAKIKEAVRVIRALFDQS